MNKIYNEDCLETIDKIPDDFLDLVITSPPYWSLRDYGHEDQIGMEPDFRIYLNKLISIFESLKSKIKNTGSLWVNLGDTYSNSGGSGSQYSSKEKCLGMKKYGGHKDSLIRPKSLLGIPDRFKIMMIDNGWICRNDIIWHKPNAMPSPIKDRFTVDYERLFFFTKNIKYYFEQQRLPHKKISLKRMKYKTAGSCVNSMRSDDRKKRCHPDGSNMRSVWSIPTKSFSGEHFAVYPDSLINIPIKACCPENGIVYDPFMGSGTTALVTLKQNKNFIGSEISKEYCEIANKRINKELKKGRIF